MINQAGAFAEVILDVQVPADPSLLLNSLVSNFESYYLEKQPSNNSFFKIEQYLEGEPHLNLIVKNLRNEVLPSSTRGDHYELHLISLKIVEDNNQAKLLLHLDASYGSEPWEVIGSSYQSLEIEYKKEMGFYCEQFLAGPIRDWVLQEIGR